MSLVAWYRVFIRRDQVDGRGFRLVATGVLSIIAFTAGYFEVAHHQRQANPTEGQILAVHIVAHETMHINGIQSEAVAECRAVQLNNLVAEKLGATPEQARVLQRSYYAEYYPRQRDDYGSGECREGGELDIYPDRTEFP